MGALGSGDAALVGRQSADADSGINGRAARQEGVCLGVAAVVGQRAKQGIGVGDVAGAGEATGGAVFQVVAI